MNFTGERFVPGIEEYDNTPMAYEHWQRYYSALNLISGKVIVDIACGEGYGSNLFADSAKQVYGIDLSVETIQHAKSKYVRENLLFSVGSIEKLDFEDHSIDVIVSYETIEHVDVDMQVAFMLEAKRVLKQDGVLILSCPNQKVASDYAFETWGYKNEFHIKEYYVDEFNSFLKRYFLHVDFSYQRFENALIMSSLNAEKLEIMLRKQEHNEHAQNMVAVCSQSEIVRSLSDSIVLEDPGRHLQLQSEIANAVKYIKTLQIDNQLVKDELEKLNLSNKVKSEEIVEANRKNELLIKELDVINQKNNILIEEVDALVKQNGVLLENIKSLQLSNNEVNQMNNVLAEYRDELNRITGTRSWKLLNTIYSFKKKIKSWFK